jgi:UDP-N-acetylglucosamine--N-acetylmuramyl-(pentapeptide) pyrophosphoryl-undecaprenol N-acetylglucosamine transferase
VKEIVHVVVAGGGTAGHIEPALATADALRRYDPSVKITALGTERGLETRLVPERGYNLALIPPVPLPRRLTLDLVKLPLRLRRAVADTAEILRSRRADVLAGFGGYVALPAYLAARRVGIPIVVHEANAWPGLANRIGARLTPHVATSVPDSPLPGAEFVGIPLRQAVATLDRESARAGARAEFGLSPDLPTVLVTGGSQGARRINIAVQGAADAFRAAGVQVLHAVGPANMPVSGDAGGPGSESGDGVPYRIVPYINRMELAYAAADLAVCRSGAMTCAELAAVGLPAVFVPLPHGNGEQRRNALPLVRAGAGLMVADGDLDAAWVRDQVPALATDENRLAAMAHAAAKLGRRDADDRLAAMIRRAASQARNSGGQQ